MTDYPLHFDTIVDDLDLHLRSQDHSVLKWYGVAGMFTMVDCVKEITSKKSCKYDEYGSYGHLLFFFESMRWLLGLHQVVNW